MLLERQEWSKQSGTISHREERVATDPRKLVIKPVAKHCQGQACSVRMMQQLESQGVEGVESIGFSPDKSPELDRRGVVAFAVFGSVDPHPNTTREPLCAGSRCLDFNFRLE